MKQLSRLAGACLSAAFLAACGGPSAFSLQSTPTNDGISQRPKVRAALGGETGPTLYVSENGGTAVYAAGGASLLRKIRPKSGAIATDPAGHLYVGGESKTAVYVYANRGGKLAWKVDVHQGDAPWIVLDPSRDLYMRCGDSNLCEYGPRNQGLLRQIRGSFGAIALDNSGNLYMGIRFNEVAVYPPGGTSPSRYITKGVTGPVALATDAAGDLYVANGYHGSQGSPNVAVYPPGGSSPVLVVSDGITVPISIALDGSGKLFVLNSCIGQGGCNNGQNSVAVYASGDSTPQKVITDGLDFPAALSLDGSNNLYVANNGDYPDDLGSVTVYDPSNYSLSRTVRRGIKYPRVLAIGP